MRAAEIAEYFIIFFCLSAVNEMHRYIARIFAFEKYQFVIQMHETTQQIEILINTNNAHIHFPCTLCNSFFSPI